MKIDLGYSYPSPISCESVKSDSKDSKHYPCVHIDNGDELLKALPDDGEMSVKFHVTSRNISDREGKKSCSITVELREITKVKGSDTNPNDSDSAAEALDKLAKLLSKESSD